MMYSGQASKVPMSRVRMRVLSACGYCCVVCDLQPLSLACYLLAIHPRDNIVYNVVGDNSIRRRGSNA